MRKRSHRQQDDSRIAVSTFYVLRSTFYVPRGERPFAWGLALLCFLLLWGTVPVRADGEQPDELLATARFDQRLNAQVPLELGFRDETGKPVRLRDYFGSKPVILALAYYNCPNICNVVLEDLVERMRDLRFDLGKQFDVVTVSIDPRETPAIAADKKAKYMRHYGRTGAASGWHALTGDQVNITRLAKVVGFNYAYDAVRKQYAHPSGIILMTPQGKISSYLYGLVYSPTDLRLGLVEASANKIGTPLDKIMLRCYRYDPISGRYTVPIMQSVRLGGLATVVGLGAFLIVMFRRDRRRRSVVSGQWSVVSGATDPRPPAPGS